MTTSRLKDYTDLDLDFTANPITGDVAMKVGPDAVARSIRNLVLTNFYDRPFQSYIGSGVQKLLFDNITPMTAELVKKFITQVITNFEPRAIVIGVSVNARIDENGFEVKIVFAVRNRPEPYSTTIFLERVR